LLLKENPYGIENDLYVASKGQGACIHENNDFSAMTVARTLKCQIRISHPTKKKLNGLEPNEAAMALFACLVIYKQAPARVYMKDLIYTHSRGEVPNGQHRLSTAIYVPDQACHLAR
jgi:hypothetical protein